MVNIGFIGAGNMGSAIMKGISNSKLSAEIKLFAADTDAEKIKNLADYGVTPCDGAASLVKTCKYVFLAVKPQVLESVLETISAEVTENSVLVSIAAGISGEFIQSKTISNAKVVLVMPNTPLLLGEGASALAKVAPTSDNEFKMICDIFSACGEIAVISKNKMKEIIAINGSSPAFIYLFAKGFVDYAKSVDIDENVAKTLFAKTLIGSAKMITNSGNSIDELIKMVSSPGGTTLKGLDELYAGNLVQVVEKACDSCTKRAYELSK
ncbi:MAG: pyrroline-5-carboxylate reductase [Oscillospiraceae bacterium]